MPEQMKVPEQFRLRKLAGLSSLALLLTAGLAACGEAGEDEIDADPIMEDAAAVSASDGDWIRLDGTVEMTGDSNFKLDYGAGTITVEADDWDLTSEGIGILPGDRVSVTGRMDRDVFTSASLEASAIYLESLNTVYFANAADEEEFGLAAIPTRPATDGIDYTGWVTGSTPKGFTLGSGTALITVDTSQLNTPLAQDGISSGDRVYVWGDLEIEREGQNKLVAEGLMELIDGPGKPQSSEESASSGQNNRSS